jgi:hypothetical protein
LYKTCTSNDVEKTFDDLMGAGNVESFMTRRRADVVFLGYFEVSPTYKLTNGFPTEGFGHMGMYENRITVKCIEQAEPLATN